MKMYSYKTFRIKNLSTGEPFNLNVSFKKLRKHRKHLRGIVTQRNTDRGIHQFLKYTTTETETSNFELSMFPVYEEFLKVMFKPKDPVGLLRETLIQFGTSTEDIERLMENKNFVSSATTYFNGITCDGERTLRTMLHVYRCAVKALIDENADLRSGFQKIFSRILRIPVE
jgi:antitoxin component HigA of HigAB toxin-antitoxin module